MLEFLRKILLWLIVVGIGIATVSLLIFTIWKVIQVVLVDLLWLLLGFLIFGGIGLACWLINDRD